MCTDVFRWVLADCMSDLHSSWEAPGQGAPLDSDTVFHAAWADFTWVFDSTRDGLESMLQDLKVAARKQTGLVTRWKIVHTHRQREHPGLRLQ